MSKEFEYTIKVVVSKTEGKSVSEEELEDAIYSELDDNMPTTIDVEDSSYQVDSTTIIRGAKV